LPKQPYAQDFCSPDISSIDIPFADAENGHRSYCTTLTVICSLHMCSLQFINYITTATNKQHIHIQIVYLLWIHYLFSNLPGLQPCPIDMEGRDGYGFNANNTDILKDPWQELASQHKLFCTNKRLL
jgi:hypothetical protein